MDPPKNPAKLPSIYAPNTHIDLRWELLDVNENSMVLSTSKWLANCMVTYYNNALIFATLNSPPKFVEKALSLQKQFGHQKVKQRTSFGNFDLGYSWHGFFNPLVLRVLLPGLDLKENASIVKFVRNLDTKCETFYKCACTFLQLMQKKSNHSKLYSIHNGLMYNASKTINM